MSMTDWTIPDDWFEDHDGQSRVLNVDKVDAEVARLRAENSIMRASLDSIRVIVNAARDFT